MNRKAALAVVLIVLLGGFFLVHRITDREAFREFFAEDHPVTAAQIEERLRAAGYDRIEVAPVRKYFDTTAVKDGKPERFVFEAETGRRTLEVLIDDPD